jgi:integrase
LSPYAENPFTALELDRLPIEHFRKIILPTSEQQVALVRACDDWQFPIFLTLMLTGLRSGELGHLLLPDDLDFQQNLLFVRNRMNLGWQVKTRNERTIPLIPCLADVLKLVVGTRTHGPIFLRRKFPLECLPTWSSVSAAEMELCERIQQFEVNQGVACCRQMKAKLAARLWIEWGRVESDRIRIEFMRLAREVGAPEITAPKTLRHLFATTLQDANVDPLIRNELMGHSTSNTRRNGLGMTCTYTHTRMDTKRSQLEAAFSMNPILAIATECSIQRQDKPNV